MRAKSPAPVAWLLPIAATKKARAFAFATSAGVAIVPDVESTDTTTTTATTTEAPAPPPSDPMLVAGYPLWVAGLVLGLALILVFWLLSRALRVLAALLALAVLAGATWVAWQHVFG